jgi:isoleucyl-tRNA synthetase
LFNLKNKDSLAKKEEFILHFWQGNKIFEESLNKTKDKPLFSFYDGPPFATGLPHYGNLLAGIIKDVIPRYKTMKGFYVPRRFGWDCHGLPVENEIEKAKELCGYDYVKKFGIANFNEECCKIVSRYTEEWKKIVYRTGRWVDFNNIYRTMDITFMESVWWVFKQIYNKGLVYEGFKVMPYSTQLGTPLSNFEANLNYREVDDPSLTVMFQTKEDKNTFFLAWTTTPWTLISNLALTVGTNIDYVKIYDKKQNKFFILAKSRLPHYFKEDFEIVAHFKGVDLENKQYVPLFNYFQNRKKEGAFRVLSDEFVSLDEGTGIVHTAPAFGEVDFYVCKKAKIDIVCPVNNSGKFTNDIPEYANMLVKDADKLIIKRLKQEGKLLHAGQVKHRYPFCWRSDTPLIYKAVKTWFVAVEKIKDELVAANKKIYWMPEHIKEGRFGNWLENARDWAISRNRYWGTPIPIWRNDDGDIIVIGSIEELYKLSKQKPTNLHRQFIDNITFTLNGKQYRRVEEVFDCWFESGSMPYAQNHYPFENVALTEKGFPADFIAEGLDQTRGWFYTLSVLSVALFKQPAFKNVIVNGIILAEDGNKMSKRLKNYPEPQTIIDKCGADALRLYLLSSPVVKAEDLCFNVKDLEHMSRQVLIPLWNSYVFLATYANIYKFMPANYLEKSTLYIDRWIVSLSQKLLLQVEEAVDKYDLSRAVIPFVEFIDQLTNWYIRRSRNRFWADEDSVDRRSAFNTLYYVLLQICKVAAPFIPFITEIIYSELRRDDMPLSVHLCDYPQYDETLRDIALEDEMFAVQKVVSLGHALRKQEKVKVRQPLRLAQIASSNKKMLDDLKKQKQLIMDELNVKDIVFLDNEVAFVNFKAKPNFPILGKKLAKDMPLAKKVIEEFDQMKIKQLFSGKNVDIVLAGNKVSITPEDVQIEREVKENIIAMTEDDIAIALDTTISEDLFLEGIAREIVNKINTMRKDNNFDVVDRIKVVIETTPKVKDSYMKFKSYIDNEILAVEFVFSPCDGEEKELNGEMAKISICKV